MENSPAKQPARSAAPTASTAVRPRPSLFRSTRRALVRGLSQLVYPDLCGNCDGHIPAGLRFVCLDCRFSMPTLDLHRLVENEMTDRFWGRLPVSRAAALLSYGEGQPARRLIWHLKYDNRPGIGTWLGGWLGETLAEDQAAFGHFDAIVPVPLHPTRQRTRGYNQAEQIANGIAQASEAEVLAQAVLRTRHTETQTKKSSFDRAKNMENVFELSPKLDLRGRVILLVDDVMTTGATLEAVGRELTKAQPAELKIATLALARNF